jgi:hypothetical protein
MLETLDEASELPFTKYVDKQSEETKGCHGNGRAQMRVWGTMPQQSAELL